MIKLVLDVTVMSFVCFLIAMSGNMLFGECQSSSRETLAHVACVILFYSNMVISFSSKDAWEVRRKNLKLHLFFSVSFYCVTSTT